MTSMLEKAARALARSRIYDGYNAETKETEFLRNKSILFAEVRVVLESIREPTTRMMEGFYGDRHDLVSTEDMDDHWREAIDAILAKGE